MIKGKRFMNPYFVGLISYIVILFIVDIIIYALLGMESWRVTLAVIANVLISLKISKIIERIAIDRINRYNESLKGDKE